MSWLVSIVFLILGICWPELGVSIEFWEIAAMFSCAGAISYGLRQIAKSSTSDSKEKQ